MVDIEGEFDLFATAFPNDLVPDVIRMILAEWPTCPRPTGVPLENRITNRLVGHLERQLREYDMPLFGFDCRPKLAADDSDSESGEIDVKVTSFSNHPDAFLVLECKRLNVVTESGFASSAGEYVGGGGMGCFLSGQYQSGGRVGAMIGYVMTREISDAISSIEGQLSDHHEELRLNAPWTLNPSSIVPNEVNVKQTSHVLDDGPFEIIHTFLKFSNN